MPLHVESKLEMYRKLEKRGDEGTDNLEVTAAVQNSARTFYPFFLESTSNNVDRAPQTSNQQEIPVIPVVPVGRKRSRRKQGLIAGASFLTCFACLCIYYYAEITNTPLLQNQEKQQQRKEQQLDPALKFLFPELSSPSQRNENDSVVTRSNKNPIEMKDNDKEKLVTTRSALSSLLSSIGYTNSNNDDIPWDFDGPPVPLRDGVKVRASPNESNRMTTARTTTARRDSVDPIVDDSSSQVYQNLDEGVTIATTGNSDMLIPSSQMHADVALDCSESVKNFVINATDVKDECDGLIKAFEKTCINNMEEEEPTNRRSRRYLNIQNRKSHPRKRKRKLWDKLNTPIILRWRAYIYQTTHALKRLVRKLLPFVGYVNFDASSVFFFAEDEVLNAWDDAQHIADNDLYTLVQSDARRSMNERQCIAEAAVVESRRLQPDVDDSNSEATTEEKHVTTTTTGTTSLQLPINHQEHVSTKFANDALLLQENGIIRKAANESATAQDEATKSKKAVSDTGNAVSAILTDPSSKEAITCCSSILTVYHDLCSIDVEEQVSDARLFFLVFVLACCGMVKSLIRHYKILWLPEAAGCILVGVISGYALDYFPRHNFSFDGNWFLRILVPPIIFQAALSIDKRSFNRHIVPIIIYAVAGTLMATCLTAAIVHYGTVALSRWCEPIPYIEALTFGALISSIDPIAVLSVLNNMGMNDTDTIYVLIFGESLLNDGVAIVLFHTLVHFLDEALIIDQEAIVAAMVHFVVVAFGSLLVGVASGMMSTIYFWAFHGCQTPLVEVLMFICWALFPYYVCDGIGWSGIVAAVAVGFVMDLHIIGQRRVVVEDETMIFEASERTSTSVDSDGHVRPKSSERSRRPIFSRYGHLSAEAKTHVGFVTEIMATGMETAIFAYLGFFLISHRYHWNIMHMITAIVACCGSRAIMIPSLSFIANGITRIQQRRAVCTLPSTPTWKGNSPAGVVVDKKMQIALCFAGLRGAMSFALVESIPLYDRYSEQGTRLKPELKAMTSACIMFTVFVLGGYTYYVLERLGIAPTNRRTSPTNTYEITALLNNNHKNVIEVDDDLTETSDRETSKVDTMKVHIPGSAFRRPRHTQGEQQMVMI